MASGGKVLLNGRQLGRKSAELLRFILSNSNGYRRGLEKDGKVPKRGRKEADVDVPDLLSVRRKISEGEMSASEGARSLGISVATMYRRFNDARDEFNIKRYRSAYGLRPSKVGDDELHRSEQIF